MNSQTEKQPGKARLIKYKGDIDSIAGWAKRLGMSRQTLYHRLMINGWNVEEALETEVRRYGDRE